MKLYVNKDNNTIVNDPKFNYPIDSIAFKRGDSATVEIIFCSNSSPLSAVEDIDIQFGIKESGKYDGDYIVYAEDYTKSEYSYVMNPNFNTVALNDLLNSGDSDDSNDVGSVSMMLEISWSSDAGTNWYSSNTITAVVNNDVNKGGESAPVPNQTWQVGYTAPTVGMLVSGAGTSAANGFYQLSGTSGGYSKYHKPSNTLYKIIYDSFFGEWQINYDTDIYYSANTLDASPDFVQTWVSVSGSLPVPTVTQSTVTNTPPFIRVADLRLYVADLSGNWKFADLYEYK